MDATGIARGVRANPALSSLGLALGLAVGGTWLMRRLRRYSLAGKNALVTGGSRGLGLEVARILVERGAHVAIVARDAAEIDRALDDLRDRALDFGTKVVGIPCDLASGASISAMLERARHALGPIDVLVNNAGVIQVGPLDAMTIGDFETATKIHCFAPLRTMLGVRNDMKSRGGGRIANIASIGGIVAVPHLMPYSMSKFALMGLSQGMHAELASDGIVVSTIAPGLMRTGSPRQAKFKGDHQKEHAWFTVSDSLPILSMSSRRAARKIVQALEYGEAHLILGAPAKVAATAHGLFPGLMARAMSVANALLPKGRDSRTRFGAEFEGTLPSIVTYATDQAALRNNEV